MTESSIQDIAERLSNQPNAQEATMTDTVLVKGKEDTPGYRTGTPKKKKLRLQLKRLRSRHSKPVRKLNYPKKIVTTKDVLQFLKSKLSKQGYALMKLQFNTKKRLTYSPQEKSLAMSVYYAGPNLYRDLRTYFKLPAPSTIRSWVGSVKLNPGICNDMFSLLKAKVQNLNIDERVCVLYLDEMSLKTNLDYHIGHGSIYGFTDYGYGQRSTVLANKALVAMIRSLKSNWEQAVSFYFSDITPVKKLKDIIFDILKELKNSGLHIVCITTHQGSNFFSLSKYLGVNSHQPYFKFEDSKVFVLADPPHLLKSTRNMLRKYCIKTTEGEIKWDYIKSCYEIYKKMNISFIPKITESHIYVPPFGGKMKVNLASQVFSSSMSIAISTLTLIEVPHKLDSKAYATSEFCNKLNNLFDIVNSSQVKCQTKFKCGLTENSCSYKYLKDMSDWIAKWVVVNENGKIVTKRFRCILGWMQTINGILQLSSYLKEIYNMKHILTRRLCQDGLQILFGSIRKKGGLRENPSCIQFVDCFKAVAFHSLMKPPDSSNCSIDNGAVLDFLKLRANAICNDDPTNVLNDSVFSEFKIETSENTCQPTKVSPIFLKTNTSDFLERNGMVYVSGYIAKKMMMKHRDCDVCQFGTEGKCDDRDDKKFLFLKNFSDDRSKGLIQPTEEFFKYIIECEAVFERILYNNYTRDNLGYLLKENIESVTSFPFCSHKIKAMFLSLFLRMRINFILKFKNKSLKGEGKNKRSRRKLKKIFHL